MLPTLLFTAKTRQDDVAISDGGRNIIYEGRGDDTISGGNRSDTLYGDFGGADKQKNGGHSDLNGASLRGQYRLDNARIKLKRLYPKL